MLFEPPSNEKLLSNRIDIWQYSLKIEPIWVPFVLNQTEHNRANRFYFQKHKRRFSVARAMMRFILGQYLQLKPEEIVFDYSPYGKPQVLDATLQFNLSHSQDTAILAVGKEYPLGVDIEFFSKRHYERIAEHSFSIDEFKQFLNVPYYLKPLTFFHLWAQKEAFIKACGLGLSYPTQKINLPSNCPSDELIEDPLTATTWRILSFTPQLGSCASLCCHPKVTKICHTIVDIPKILSNR